MTSKVLAFDYNQTENYGKIGEVTGISITNENDEIIQIHVGDIVYWKCKDPDPTIHGYGFAVVCKNTEKNRYTLMGWFSLDMLDNSQFEIKSIVVPHNLLTGELLQYYHPSMIVRDVKQVTLDEIRQYVPFDFELVGV